MKQAPFNQAKCLLAVLFVLLYTFPVLTPAQEMEANRFLALEQFGSGGLSWIPLQSYDFALLSIATPEGRILRKQLSRDEALTFGLGEFYGFSPRDGEYTYELTFVSGEVVEDSQSEQTSLNEPLKHPLVVKQAGGFGIRNGSILDGSRMEPQTEHNEPLPLPADPSTPGALSPMASQVYNDDLIVQGSECVGIDCVTDENFGFSTIKLKENNTRLTFTDTSTEIGMPYHDWQLTANDSASGGLNRFYIENLTTGRTPFSVHADAPTNTLYLAGNGRVGIGTATPGYPLEISRTGEQAILVVNRTDGVSAKVEATKTKMRIGTISDHPIRFQVNNAFAMDLSTRGHLGIGVLNPEHPLQMASGAYCSRGGVWTNASSISLKENIRPLDGAEAAAALSALNPVQYNYKSVKDEDHLGFIAEEVPDLVATRNRKGMSPMDVAALLTRVVQDQESMIRQLEEQVKALELQLKEEHKDRDGEGR